MKKQENDVGLKDRPGAKSMQHRQLRMERKTTRRKRVAALHLAEYRRVLRLPPVELFTTTEEVAGADVE